jgi:hypothetical protein
MHHKRTSFCATAAGRLRSRPRPVAQKGAGDCATETASVVAQSSTKRKTASMDLWSIGAVVIYCAENDYLLR